MPVTFTASQTVTAYTFRELLAAAEDKSSGVTQKAVDKARSMLQQRATDHDWWDDTYDSWAKLLEAVGFIDPKICFSGFWSQGDGASFTSGIDIEKMIRFLADPPTADRCWHSENERDLWAVVVHKVEGVRSDKRFSRLLWIADHYDAAVKRTSNHYSHANTCTIEGGFDLPSIDSGHKDRGGYTVWVPKHHRLSKLAKSFEEAVEQLRLDLCHAIYRDLEEEYEYLTNDDSLADQAEANDELFDQYGNLIDAPDPINGAELAAWESMC